MEECNRTRKHIKRLLIKRQNDLDTSMYFIINLHVQMYMYIVDVMARETKFLVVLKHILVTCTSKPFMFLLLKHICCYI